VVALQLVSFGVHSILIGMPFRCRKERADGESITKVKEDNKHLSSYTGAFRIGIDIDTKLCHTQRRARYRYVPY